MSDSLKSALEEELAEAISLSAEESDAGVRIDSFIAARCDVSRSAVAKLIEREKVLVNGKAVQKNYKLRGGETLEVEIPLPEDSTAEPEDIPLDVVYEDEDIIVVNKPKGMVVHPAPGNPSGTLVNALLYHCKGSLSGVGGVVRPGIVHRIDKDTAGLIVSAKNDSSHLFLSEEIKEHKVSRIYYAIVLGNFKEDEGTVDAPIGRHPVDRKRMAVIRDPSKGAKRAVTHFSVVERFGRFSFVRCELETGRTHQIRVHMSSIGHPLMGDTVYGGGGTDFERQNKKYINGQCLFAAELWLTHPVTREKMQFKAELPFDMSLLLEKLRGELR
ncbi:MAG: RluA family pseudouridine synthase [Ruminococcaceae bacterium]|nr:RluA family pseudouridine synthase [Oscillospiraceae bacterium]